MPIEIPATDPSVQPNGPAPTTATSVLSGAPPTPPAAPAPAAAAAPPPPAPSPAAAQIVHHAGIGSAVAKLFNGGRSEYTVDPKTGETTASFVKDKPGEMFRHILWGALLGGAASAAARRPGQPQNILEGFGAGGTAVVQDGRALDERRREQAQQQFKNQLTAQQAQREEQRFHTEEVLRKATIAHANSETFRNNVLTAGESLDQHEKAAAAGRVHFADYKAAGLAPTFKDIPESEMQNLMANREGLGSLDWEPTGTRVRLDPSSGMPTYEFTYSAYDVTSKKIPVSSATLAQWKQDGLDKVYPELFETVKPGTEIDALAYVHFKQLDEKLVNDSFERRKRGLDIEKTQAEIKAHNAETAERLAQASRIKREEKESQLLAGALDELDKKAGDFDQLSPKSKFVIGQNAQKMAGDALSEAKVVLQADPDDREGKAKALLQEADGWRSLASQAVKRPTPQLPHPTRAGQLITSDVVDEYLKVFGNAAAARAAAQRDGWSLGESAPTAAPPAQNTTNVLPAPLQGAQLMP